MSLRSTLGVVRRRVLCAVHRREIALKNREPIVSFCFDDFPRTAYTTGGRILKEFGARGTYYVAASLMNTSGKLGELCRSDDLYGLIEEGHELGHQTYAHVSCRRLTVAQFREDVRQGQSAIRALGLEPSGNFAYPYGEVTISAKKVLGDEMTSCRGIYGGLNGRRVDLSLLRANSLYGDVEKQASIERMLAQNEAECGWLIFYTHDVRQDPSKFGCTPRLLEAVVSGAVQRGARVLTVSAVLADLDLGSQKSHSEDSVVSPRL